MKFTRQNYKFVSMVINLAPFNIYLMIQLLLAMASNRTDVFPKDDDNSKYNYCQSTAELSEYLKLSLKSILNKVTDENFVSIYKTCYKEFEKKDNVGRPALNGSSTEGRKYRTQFNEIITKTANKIIEETVLDLNSKLKELEEFKLAQSDSIVLWRPPGNALQHMIPFECVSELDKKKELEGKIDREQEALGILKTRLNQKRNKARELHEILITLFQEVKHIVTSKVNSE